MFDSIELTSDPRPRCMSLARHACPFCYCAPKFPSADSRRVRRLIRHAISYWPWKKNAEECSEFDMRRIFNRIFPITTTEQRSWINILPKILFPLTLRAAKEVWVPSFLSIITKCRSCAVGGFSKLLLCSKCWLTSPWTGLAVYFSPFCGLAQTLTVF